MPYRLIAIKADERRWWEETGDWLGPPGRRGGPEQEAPDLEDEAAGPRNTIPGELGGQTSWGGNFIGVHRAVAVFRSPQTGALHVSAMGGAAYRFMRTGVNGLVIIGKFNKPTLILIGSKAGKLSVEFQEVDLDRLWGGYGGAAPA